MTACACLACDYPTVGIGGDAAVENDRVEFRPRTYLWLWRLVNNDFGKLMNGDERFAVNARATVIFGYYRQRQCGGCPAGGQNRGE